MEPSNDISKGLRVTTMIPLDIKTRFVTLDEMKNLGEDYNRAFTYYDGLKTFCLEDRNSYIWKEVAFGEKGVLPQNFVYPPDTVIGDVDYSSKTFNFVIDSGKEAVSKNTMFIEPSVNLQFSISESPYQAMFFGKLDIGNGLEDVALVKEIFVHQSNYDILAPINAGDEIKIYNSSNSSYIGHFKTTVDRFSGFMVMEIIEKGNWPEELEYPIQELVIHVVREALYSFTQVDTKIELYRGNQKLDTIDFALLLDNSGASITGGVLDANTGLITFTLSNATTIDVDFSAALNTLNLIEKNSSSPVASSAIYENIFNLKAGFSIVSGGFYSADITTNYTSTSIAGFPHPAGRTFVVLKYNNILYLIIPKSSFYIDMFRQPNMVLSFSFFKRSGNSMIKLGYFKVLTRSTVIPNLNSTYEAFQIWENNNIPGSVSGGSFNEFSLINGINEVSGEAIVTQSYMEMMHLNKTITLPYTLTDKDHGLVLNITNTGNLTIPKLNHSFECGFIKNSSSASDIVFLAANGVNLKVSEDKLPRIDKRYHTAYLMSTRTGISKTGVDADDYVLTGSLKNE